MRNKLLNIPVRVDAEPVGVDVSEPALKAWTEALPLMDYAHSCKQVTDALNQLNRQQVEIMKRITAMTLLSNHVDKLHKIVPRNFDSDALPLSAKQLESKLRPQRLLLECATGHKIIVVELLEDKKLLAKNKKSLFLSLVKALHYMLLELIENFLSYRTPEAGTWQDMHKLYAIAEQLGVVDVAVSGSAAQGEASTTIGELYKKILLLSLADYSRLMNGEAEMIYQQLPEWSKLTSLSCPDDSFREGIVVDLGVDAPANHVFSEKPIKFLNGRLFDIAPLLAHMDAQIDALAEQGQQGDNMLGARTRQAMYIRLRFTWGTRSERGASRQPINNPVKLISGLHDCHRGLSGNAPFNPEHDELRFDPEWNKVEEQAPLPDDLSLVPEGEDPWMKDVIEARVAANVNGHRVSQFDEHTKADAWEKIYANQIADQGRREREVAPLMVIDCVQVDTSPGGMAILCSHEQVDASLAVGKVVAIYEEGDAEVNRWQIGVVRWLVMLPSNDIRCGVQVLSHRARTVATKSIKGVGENGEYFRSIMIPAEDGYPTSVIVPAAVYSTNSILSVVAEKELIYLALKELLNNSASYNQFSFEKVDEPTMGINLKAKIDHNRRSF